MVEDLIKNKQIWMVSVQITDPDKDIHGTYLTGFGLNRVMRDNGFSPIVEREETDERITFCGAGTFEIHPEMKAVDFFGNIFDADMKVWEDLKLDYEIQLRHLVTGKEYSSMSFQQAKK